MIEHRVDIGHPERVFLAGRWCLPRGTAHIDVIDPYRETVVAQLPAANAADVDAAVSAAREALPAWSQTSPAVRAELLTAIASRLTGWRERLASTITTELGAPIELSRRVQVGVPIVTFSMAANVARRHVWSEQLGNSLVVQAPVGVVGCITPWNYPLHQIAAKLAYALAAGCCVVLKPSELTPLNAYLLFEVLEAVGLPPGVVNLVPGTGTEAGEALARHPDVAMLSFTGSTAVGRRLYELGGATIKKLALELGGKSPLVVLDASGLATAMAHATRSVFTNSGQTCAALTRVLVPRTLAAEAGRLAVAAAARERLGDPFDPQTTMGPLVSATQRDRVLQHIRDAIEDGAVQQTGADPSAPGSASGYFVPPTVFTGVATHMRLAQEEVFGPVLAIMGFHDDDEALALANDSRYGLSAAVFCDDRARASAFARALCCGEVAINGGGYNPLAPFGGTKQSGLGREFGEYGLEEFLEPKAIHLPRGFHLTTAAP